METPKCKECGYHRQKRQTIEMVARHWCIMTEGLTDDGRIIPARCMKESPLWCPKRDKPFADKKQ